MLPLGVAIGSVLIDASLAIFALVVGFYTALWYFKNAASSGTSNSEEGADTPEAQTEANDAERTQMAALQVRDLAKNMATDVGAHNTLVSDISSELGSMTNGSSSGEAAVAAAVERILAANEKLQNRLIEAEQKIQTQAEEIRTQQSEALTDSLTNLANRRAFDEALQKNITNFKEQRKPFSLLIFDVDHFKNFNDTHGHLAGDEVLRRVGQTLTETTKTTDLPCRYGGEEFALILPNTKVDSARIAAEQVRKAIEAMDVEFEGKHLSVTASIGVAEIQAGEDDTKLIRRSDDGVYAAKEAGRNQTYWNNGSVCLPLNATSAEESTKPKPGKGTKASQSSTEAELPTQETFTNELQRRVAESHRFGVSLSVMHINVNGYAGIEKEYGNAVGSLLLDSVAQFIRSSLRDMDLLGQLKAGDFIVMLPGSSEKEAKLVGKRVQTAISNCVIPLGGRELKLEISHGVADVYPDDDAQTMIDRAAQMSSSPNDPVAT